MNEIKIVAQENDDSIVCCLAMLTGINKSNFTHTKNFNSLQVSDELKKYGMKIDAYSCWINKLINYSYIFQQGTYLVSIYRGNSQKIIEKKAGLDLIVIKDGLIYDPLFMASGIPIKNNIYEMHYVCTICKITST